MPEVPVPNQGPFTFMSDHERGLVMAIIIAMYTGQYETTDDGSTIITTGLHNYQFGRDRKPDLITSYNHKTMQTHVKVIW